MQEVKEYVILFAKCFVLLTALNYLIGSQTTESLITVFLMSFLLSALITLLKGTL